MSIATENLLQSDLVQEDISFFQCSRCGENLEQKRTGLACSGCGHLFVTSDGIHQLYAPNEWDSSQPDVTDEVKAFYEDSPFPNYDDFDSKESLSRKAKEGLFARMLDEQVPSGARIIEVGCGTGQLSNFLSIGNREVIGADLCLNSLKLGRKFSLDQGLDNVRFVQMNLFRPPFKSESFHLVISNGVLHHTSDPRGGFNSIARLVKPGGYILIGLYHYWGRLITDARRFIFNVTGDRLKFLDPNLRREMTSDVKKDSWFNDQYKHPHESKHTIREACRWLDAAGFDFVKSIPTTHLFREFSTKESLFTPEEMAPSGEAFIKELLEIHKGSQEGGFFTLIGKKRIRDKSSRYNEMK